MAPNKLLGAPNSIFQANDFQQGCYMKYYSYLVEAVKNAGNEIFWQGGCSSEQLKKLEELLGLTLPSSFKDFLKTYGGGGVIDAEISGIEDNDALIDTGGTVYGDTSTARKDYGLPDELAVIYFRDDEVCWCLDARNKKEDSEYPVVNYNLFSRKIENQLSDSFEQFFEEYLKLRASTLR